MCSRYSQFHVSSHADCQFAMDSESPRLVDFFVLCGLRHSDLPLAPGTPSGARSSIFGSGLQPCVLAHYPEIGYGTPFDEAAVTTLCMPNGVSYKKNVTSSVEDSAFHTFLITREDGSHAHGCVVTFFEPIESKDTGSALHAMLSEKQKVNFSFDPKEDTLYVSKSVCTVSAYPVIRPLRSFLFQMVSTVLGSSSCKAPLEAYIRQLLFEIPMPVPGQQLMFWGPEEKVLWQHPPGESLPLFDYSMMEFLETIGLGNLVKLFTTVLLEHQLLLKSTSYEKLMLCAQCLVALLYPFEWQQVFVPILPSSQLGFLDAPVPFIMGIRVDPEADQRMEFPNMSSLCLYDIDSELFSSSDDLPKLPREDELLGDIRKVMEDYSVTCSDIHIAPLPVRQRPASMNKDSIIEAIKAVTSDPKGFSAAAQIGESTNPHVQKLVDIMSRIQGTDVSPTTGAHEMSGEVQGNGTGGDATETHFAMEVRDVFVRYMVELFSDYEDFVIIPQQSYEQWIRDREQFQNFDKTSFLSDQSNSSIPFLSAFVETQMFSQFIDHKIVAMWKADEALRNVIAFDLYIKAHLEKTGAVTSPHSRSMPGTPDFDAPGAKMPVYLERPAESSEGTVEWCKGLFPTLSGDSSLKKSPEMTPLSGRKPQNSSLRRKLRQVNASPSTFSATSHSNFVLQLWRETRTRVKHMLSIDPNSQTGVEEENTMIAKMCDLLERIWGHGLRKRESRSPLWSHLMAFADVYPRDEAEDTLSCGASPALHTTSTPALTEGKTPPKMPRSQSILSHFHRQRLQSPGNRSKIETLEKPPEPSFFEDLQVVNGIPEIKTDVGRVRAWVRLTLEKKSLAHHLKMLLSNQELCTRRYLGYAFLRTEDEREQFITFLLTLNARSFTCFTSAFRNVVMKYCVLVLGEGKHMGFHTACLYVNIGGEHRTSGKRIFVRGENQLEFQNQNMGPLTCIRIGHDRSGVVTSLFVDSVLVQNLTTGQIYKFLCGRWLSASEDDSAVERFLLADCLEANAVGKIVDSSSLYPVRSIRSWKKHSKSHVEEAMSLSEIKQTLTRCVTGLVQLTKCQSRGQVHHGQVLKYLMNAKVGFVSTMEHVFALGFTAFRKFPYFWDFLEQAVSCLPEETVASSMPLPVQSLTAAIGQLQVQRSNLGKDEKFFLLLALGLRDRQLHDWMRVICCLSVVSSVYEPTSFFRDAELSEYLIDKLQNLSQLEVPVGDLLLHGL